MQKTFTVSELTEAVKNKIEPHFRLISVQGEISNLKKHSSGHIYFSLKDKNAQISAAFFRGAAARCPHTLKDGDHVTCTGDISIYPPRGSYQIIVRELQLIGLGELLLKLHELKQTLASMGYFDSTHKKKLPPYPQKIGIITSPTGAVIQDVLNVLKRRFSNFHLVVNPVKVQGEGAKEEIAQAIHDCNRFQLADVLIVARGGGTLEDLWAFNEKVVADAIFASEIPIISAVGHETDHTIADYVADFRAPTPSAAAEIVTKEKMQLLETLENSRQRLSQCLLQKTKELKKNLTLLQKHPLLCSSDALLGKKMQLIDEKTEHLFVLIRHHLGKIRSNFELLKQKIHSNNPFNQVQNLKQSLHSLTNQLNVQIKKELFQKKQFFLFQKFSQKILETLLQQTKQRKERLTQLCTHLASIDPKNLLKKGYSILFSEKTNSFILSPRGLKSNDRFIAILDKGKIYAQVNYVKSEIE